MREVYLDNNATTLPIPEVLEGMLDALGPSFGNAASSHSGGERARRLLSAARDSVAKLIGADPEHVFFTSGATEANNLLLSSVLRRGTDTRLITTTTEHSSILRAAESLGARGTEVTLLPVDSRGMVDPSDLRVALENQADLVSIHWVNNETGTVQPIEVLVEICRQRGVPFHCDAAQAVGKLEVDVRATGIDYLTLTGHKIHGPQGSGALYARDPAGLRPLQFGGSQEGGIRPGTESLHNVVGLGVAAAARRKNLQRSTSDMGEMRDLLESLVRAELPWVDVNGNPSARVCNTTNLLFRGIDGQALLGRLDAIGVRCSQSSACTSQRPEPSYVLRAMGLTEEEAYSSVRFAVSPQNSHDELKWAATAIIEESLQLRELLGEPVSSAVP